METRPLVLLIAALGVSACSSTELLPGRCDSTSDCAPGLTCNLDRTLQGNGRCVAIDDGAAGSFGDGSPETSSDVGGSAGTGAIGGSDGGPIDVSEVMPGCGSSAECPAASPICGTDGVCRACNASNVGQTACAILDPTHPTCASTGTCVVCSTNVDCGKDPTKPICDVLNQRCVSCTTDSQCIAKLGANPGVCMSHQDGRCATDAETFYVVNQTGCSDAGTGPTAGTAAAPFCSLDPAAMQAGGTRSVIVVRGPATAPISQIGAPAEVSIVGQQSGGAAAAIGSSALHVGPGNKLYVRDMSITAVNGVGIFTDSASTLRLDHVTVSNSSKGGLQLGGAFDISNSTITGNGPGSDGALFWGGIYVQFPPAGGPSRLSLVTVTNNKSSGVVCTSGISGTGVLATGNAGGDISLTCGFTSCATAGTTCGAQP